MPPEPADRLVRALKKTGRRRIALEMLRQQFAMACPELAEQPDRRMRLADALRSAADSGAILLPKQSRSWDRTGGAALPGFVLLATPRSKPLPVVLPGYGWHPLLAFAAGERNRLRLQSAKRINEWLKTDPNLNVVVPIKERSLEIFGDEKRLDQLRGGMTTLFGQLTLAALGCRVCPIPLPFEAGPASARGQPILIVENNDTWASFSEWNRRAGRFAVVAYAGGGHGKSLGYDETFIDELLDRFQATQLFYFGDIDPAGLRIASRAAERRARRGGLALRPMATLYAWLLSHGTRTALRSGERASPSDLAWLPQDLRDPVEALFSTGQRLPQESLGTRILSKGEIHF
ncbi:Wadjet anti-phage system protein JetD domain-containing protein [Bradyrhizobium sp. CCBAU 51627]|uniref:Wadjet anti-phage system protein JetD domain-containing protein n=1 Tax=Bradyrhizobium sp. CCBAU 51627 TaxID=1325088 RepID=UPI0023055D72|nr:Wadjet anti-phage system protein JetD domain-containing protein [Bradyrhizobium sp. CCBAU 51627]MDA9433694.1 hypothetical protein [Bradyrhizobium sp. CCBAU 51627]